ncbi:E3 ubiquitin-protein ligase TRIM39-like isoform X3 [Amia ocellicauda]|uniref:E3 ubiquitin-protein ligase TRIM39-like isoform X3 n=1 Tax=Amia ocellicauda TaxID=2972642 RepID=UPI003464152F
MACPSSLMSEEQFHCSICQDIFTNPVSTPCGHNYCMACIGGYWDSSAVCQCPMCQKTFPIRPDLSVNTVIAGMAEQMKEKLVPPEERSAQPGEVTCDACSGRKLRAVKSCLVCLTSYCSVHIKPHYDVVKLTKHKLIEPVNNLEDWLCKQHDRVLELFCRSDQTCVCVLCTETDHKTHRTVSPESEWTEKKTQLGVTVAEAQQMIQDRRKKMEEIRQSVELSKLSLEKEVQDSAQVFSALVRSIERSQAELIELIEGKQRVAERWAEGLIEELQQEITELERRRTELEQLEHVEDHIHFLQSFPALCPHTQTKDWSGISVHPDVCVGAVRKAVSQLEEKLGEELQKLANTELKRIQQYAVDVTLDPNTAAPWLLLSKDGKQVRLGDREQDFPDNPERFDTVVSVLGKEGFSSGRHYWEVKVEEITNWDLGVARESVNRKGDITLNPESGYWSVILRDGNEYRACAGPAVLLHLKQKPRKVGVYVDHEGGQVSFYNAEAGSHIYTFTDTFTEKLYPFFSPCFKMGGKKATPLIISPVRHSD